MALRAAAPGVIDRQHQSQGTHDESDDDHEDHPRRKFAAVAAEVRLAPFEHRGRSLDARDHARAVIPLAEGRKHIIELYAFAERIGKDSLQSAARDEAYFAQFLHQQDAQSVVALGRAHAPAAEQFDGERKSVAALNVIDSDDRHLRKPPFAQRRTEGVDARHGSRGENAVGIRDIAPPVHALDIGNLVRAVASRKGGQHADEQQTKDRNLSHNLGNKDT